MKYNIILSFKADDLDLETRSEYNVPGYISYGSVMATVVPNEGTQAPQVGRGLHSRARYTDPAPQLWLSIEAIGRSC